MSYIDCHYWKMWELGNKSIGKLACRDINYKKEAIMPERRFPEINVIRKIDSLKLLLDSLMSYKYRQGFTEGCDDLEASFSLEEQADVTRREINLILNDIKETINEEE